MTMPEYSFQETLVRFLLEKKVREAVYSNDADLQAKFNILPEYVSLLTQINAERVDFFSKSIEHKRIRNLTRQLPLICKVLGKNLPQICSEFFPGDATNDKDPLRYSLDFANYVRNNVDLSSFPSYVPDVVEYELNKLNLLSELAESNRREKNVCSSGSFLSKTLDDEIFLNLVFAPSFRHKIFSVNFNIFEIVKQLIADASPNAVRQSGIYGLIYLNDKDEIAGCVLNDPTINFIRMCDGKNSLHQIVGKLLENKNQADSSNFNKAKRECIELSKSLFRMGVIEISES